MLVQIREKKKVRKKKKKKTGEVLSGCPRYSYPWLFWIL